MIAHSQKAGPVSVEPNLVMLHGQLCIVCLDGTNGVTFTTTAIVASVIFDVI